MLKFFSWLFIVSVFFMAGLPAQCASSVNSKNLVVLKAANRFDEAQTGDGDQKSAIYNAYENLLKGSSDCKVSLQGLVNNASPAGRVYAAILLQHLDKSIGRQEIEKLTHDKSPVRYYAGCKGRMTTVGFLVTHINSTNTGQLINFEQ